MSLAYKCDRCQKFFLPNEKNMMASMSIKMKSINQYDGRCPINKCDSCAEELDHFVKRGA